MKAGERDGKSTNHRLADFLFTYRFTKHATTNVSPSELFLKRKLRTRFDLLKPDIKNFVFSKQTEQKSHHDGSAKLRILFPSQSVMVMNYRSSDKWIPGTVLKKLGPVTYCIEIDNGKIIKRHIDQLRHSSTPSGLSTPHISNPDTNIQDNFQYSDNQDHVPPEPEPRYPHRIRRPPDRLMFVSKYVTFPFDRGGNVMW